MTDDLPPRLTTELFRTASGARLQEIYRTLFHRIAEREDELHVFTDGGFSPRRVLDVLDDLEHHWPDPRVRPPLFGVPVGVKDLYRTAGYAIHAGSLLPASCFRGPEADIVTALKKLGCVVMGITQSSEFAGAAPASTCNPLNPGHTPGGSSSGSAAGVAAGYFPLALGTQTKGSVVRPASYCGVIGVKPGRGTLSTAGIVPFSESVDQPGFFCSSMSDAALVLDALVVPDSARPGVPRFWSLAVPRGPYLEEADPVCLKLFEAVCRKLSESEALLIRDCDVLPDWPSIREIHERLTSAELAATHDRLWKKFGCLVRQPTRDCVARGREYGQQAILRGCSSAESLRARLAQHMGANHIDAFIAPAATGPAPAGLDSTGDPVMNVPWTHAGLPVLCLPMGSVSPDGTFTVGRSAMGADSLPVGLQIVGRPGSELTLPVLGHLAGLLLG